MMDMYDRAGIASYRACSALGRSELYNDVKQDLAELSLRRDSVNLRYLYLRGIDFILSKRYNETWAGRPIAVAGKRDVYYSFVDEKILADQLLDVLSPRERNVVELWMDGYKQREIAGFIKVSRCMVSKILKMAFSLMREVI